MPVWTSIWMLLYVQCDNLYMYMVYNPMLNFFDSLFNSWWKMFMKHSFFYVENDMQYQMAALNLNVESLILAIFVFLVCLLVCCLVFCFFLCFSAIFIHHTCICCKISIKHYLNTCRYPIRNDFSLYHTELFCRL